MAELITSPSDAGARAEAAVASALVRSGHVVFVPIFGAHSRVDLVYDGPSGLRRVQCKTARSTGDTIFFRTCSNTRNMPRTYEGEVDEFGVFSPATGLVYVVPYADTPERLCTLRLGPTSNNQQAGIRWARDYELGPP